MTNTALSPAQLAIADALGAQSWFQRRKDSLAAGAGAVLQIANLVALIGVDSMPTWLNIVIAVVIGVAQIIAHATTKGAFTPSMIHRVETTVVDSTAEDVPLTPLATADDHSSSTYPPITPGV